MKIAIVILVFCLLGGGLAGCGEQDRAATYFARGQALYEAGDLVKARLEFRNALQVDPKHAPAWFMIGQIEATQQAWQKAFAAFNKAVELDPGHLAARTSRGELLLAGGSPEEALAEATAVLDTEPANAGALALRAMVRQRQGDQAAAAADANAALALSPTHKGALLLLARQRIDAGALDEGRALVERAVAAHPKDSALRVVLIGVDDQLGATDRVRSGLLDLIALEPKVLSHRLRLASYLKAQGDTAGAEQVLREAITALPGDQQAVLVLVDFLARERGPEEAQRALQGLIAASPDDHTLRFALADLYRTAGDAAQTEAIYRDIAARDPAGAGGLRARAALATLLLAAGRTDEAAALASDVLAKDARDEQSLLVRAAIALQRADAPPAVADLRALLGVNPDSLPALQLLARAHVLNKELPLAQDSLEKAIAVAPADPSSYLQLADLRATAGDPEGALLVLDRLLKQDPENKAAPLAMARLQLAKQDVAALGETAARALQASPEHPLGHYLQGVVLQLQGQTEASIAELDKAIELSPQAVEPRVALARSHIALGQAKEAEALLRPLVTADPGNIVLVDLLARVYRDSGRDGDARELYAAVIGLRSQSPLGYDRLATLAGLAGELAEAEDKLRAGVEATGRNPLLLLRLGMLLDQRGDYDQAAAIYAEVLQRVPGQGIAANNLAMLLVERRGDDPASLRRAVELVQGFESSTEAGVLDTAGWVQFRAGNYQQAVALLEKAAGTGEPVPAHRYHLGMAYLKLGRRDDAKAQLTAALADETPFPGREEAHAALAQLQ